MNIPELLVQIFAVVPVSECTRLITTSRAVFNAAAPRIWEEVPDSYYLLSLIPGTGVSMERTGLFKIDLPPYSQSDFSRFSIYSPYVKALGISGAAATISPWRTLLEKIKGGPLFPNLKFLRWKNSNAVRDNLILWVHVFASPSLRSIETENASDIPACCISSSALSVVLSYLGGACPAFESLSIFPGLAGYTEESDGEQPFSALLWKKPLYYHLANLSNLSQLTTNTSILSPEGILALSALPRLRSLDLSLPTMDLRRVESFEAVSLTPTSFPALHSLKLHFLPLLDIWTIWHDMEPMIARLTVLKLELSPRRINIPETPDFNTFISNYFPLICDRSPNIADLSINWGGLARELFTHNGVLDMYAQHSRRLPLQRLSNRYFGGPMDNLASSDLQSAWAGITELIIRKYGMVWGELRHLAAFPKLERLSISLNREIQWEFPSSGHLCIGSGAFHTLQLASLEFATLQDITFENLAR
ncbi:hypothetical protein FRC10_008393 [Ceratobasidium sp. 414]|nr:hypothetical protein FRC10_008393 [Ceratobasidium sp. 414]